MTTAPRGSAGRVVRRTLAGLALCLGLGPGLVAATSHLSPGDTVPVQSGPVLVRAAPDYAAEVLAEAATGTWVTVTEGPIAALDGSLWYLVDAGGYVPSGTLGDPVTAPAVADQPEGKEASYLAAIDAAANGSDVAAEAPVALPPSESFDTGNVIATAWIAGTNGAGAVCRVGMDGASGETGWLAEGQAVDVIGETIGEWQPVSCGGVASFVHASAIAWQPPTTVDAGGGDRETTSAAALVLPEPGRTAAEAGQRNKRDRGGDGSGSGRSDTSGQGIVDFAMQFEGYPYVYAGEGPNAFDCSGFTMFVIKKTLGIEITHDMFAQYDMGRQVDRSELQPGDLVFFQNTFRPGMSHNGIYIGGGKMIHAENEGTGVKVSDINAEYYSSRWYGAVRFS